MAWHWWALRTIAALEDRIVALILRQPGFHRAVGRVHKTIHERKHGRNPHEPLSQGEATTEPTEGRESFLKHFRDEVRNQLRGKPTDWPGDKPGK